MEPQPKRLFLRPGWPIPVLALCFISSCLALLDVASPRILLIVALCGVLSGIVSYWEFDLLAIKFDDRLRRRLGWVALVFILALIATWLVAISVMAVVRSDAFEDWAILNAPNWLSRPFLFKGRPWLDLFEEAVISYSVAPALLIVYPCLAIGLLRISGKARSWGKTDLAFAVEIVTTLLGILYAISLLWQAGAFEGAREKPVIYLYPQTEQTVTVKLKYPGVLLHTYPAYSSDGWKVLAKPSGELVDLKTGRKHRCLFWEGQDTLRFALSTGFVVEGRNTAGFLEEKLATLGLSESEADVFIIYLLPRLEKNRFNVIHFATQEWDERVPIEVTPVPDTLIRVLMVFRTVSSPPQIEQQVLTPSTRHGFTVVEWGGTEVE